ncbi:helix-turn-helix transcriptional regulator [Embleya sp. NPDC050154]|uniref:helix-turn-helix transcriptional regulator n=1 Tax=Embleya sp. NPDC050154 TaxID=3363988 RepID=UPI0037B9D525
MTDRRIGTAKTTAPRPPKPTDKLTLDEVCDELRVARSTFYDWRQKGRAPRCIKLPNGDLRVRRQVLDDWLDEREDAD